MREDAVNERSERRSGSRDDVILPTSGDWLMVGGLAALSALSVFVAHDLWGSDLETKLPRWAEHILLTAMLIVLAWRRQHPLSVLAVVSVLALGAIGLRVPDGLSPSIALFIALYAAGAYSHHPSRDLLRGGCVAATLLLAGWQLLSQQEFVGFDAALFSVHMLAVNVAFLIAGWLLGDSVRRRRADQVELRRRADELAAEQQAKQQRAVLDERVRIARELHDVVAHHVSVMGVQASAARRVLPADPDQAVDALRNIEDSARDAVGELQRLLGFLRAAQEDPGPPSARVDLPQPRLADLDRLIGSAGVPVQVHHVGRPRAVPAAVELCAFRLVQEALTNVLKHAGAAPTTVVLTHSDNALGVEVVNERGTAPPAVAPGSGRGLLGMRERVRMAGGELSHGTTPRGGYRVVASLPVSREVSAAAQAVSP